MPSVQNHQLVDIFLCPFYQLLDARLLPQYAADHYTVPLSQVVPYTKRKTEWYEIRMRLEYCLSLSLYMRNRKEFFRFCFDYRPDNHPHIRGLQAIFIDEAGVMNPGAWIKNQRCECGMVNRIGLNTLALPFKPFYVTSCTLSFISKTACDL